MKPTSHYIALDGLRGLAAYAVLIVHLSIPFAVWTVPHGYLAVDFFFILSGLVIARAYEQRLLDKWSLWDFIRIRLIRLYPLLFLGTAAGTIVIFLKAHLEKDVTYFSLCIAFVSAVFMVPLRQQTIHDSNDAFPLNMPAWSLFFEFIINLFYAAFVCHLTKKRLIIVVILSAIALGVAGLLNGDLDGGYRLSQMPIGLARVFFSFSAGVLIFRLYGGGKKSGTGGISAYFLATILVGTFIVPTFSSTWIYDCGCIMMVYPVIIATGMKAKLNPRASRIALFLGEISYPLYIIHYPIVTIFTHFMRSHVFSDAGAYGIIAIETIIITFIAYGVMRIYDIPLRTWLKERFTMTSDAHRTMPPSL